MRTAERLRYDIFTLDLLLRPGRRGGGGDMAAALGFGRDSTLFRHVLNDRPAREGLEIKVGKKVRSRKRDEQQRNEVRSRGTK